MQGGPPQFASRTTPRTRVLLVKGNIVMADVLSRRFRRGADIIRDSKLHAWIIVR